MDVVSDLTRRRLLQSATYGVAVSSLALLATPAAAIGGGAPIADTEPVAERHSVSKARMSIMVPMKDANAESVAITVSVDKGSAADVTVQSIYVLAEGAASPELARFYPSSTGAVVTVLGVVHPGQCKRIWAVAQLTDGSVCMASTDLVT